MSPKGLLGRGRRPEALRFCLVLVSGLLSGFYAEWILTGVGKGGQVLDWPVVVSARATAGAKAWEWGSEEHLGAQLGVSLFRRPDQGWVFCVLCLGSGVQIQNAVLPVLLTCITSPPRVQHRSGQPGAQGG